MHTEDKKKYKVKLIKLQDTFVDNSKQFPYIHTIKSNIRFRLRSKITYDHQPILLIEKLNSFDYILPMKNSFDLNSKACQQNFICLKGNFDSDGAWYVQLPDKVPGIVSFQIAFVPIGSTIATRYGTCDVVFLTQEDNQLRKLRKQSIFPRCIGKYKQWKDYFLRQMQMGYNSFHFAPIQQTGVSKSYYSLKDHLDLSDDIFQGSKQQKMGQLVDIITDLKKKGVVFFIDIVLNHCSFDSEWIQQHESAVYTPQNTPLLRPAFEVDDIIYRWGNQIKALLSNNNNGPDKIQLDQQFLKEIQLNLKNALYSLALQEYFILSDKVEKTLLQTVAPRKPSQNLFAKDPIDSIKQFLSQNVCDQCQEKRQVKIKNISKWKQENIAYQVSDLKMAINNYNNKWIKKIREQWIPQIVFNTMNQVRHNYWNNNYRDFDDPYPFVSKYFSRIQRKKINQNQSNHFYALNNGWVANADSSENFALSKQFYYLRRRVNVWGDLIRIRYGQKPNDSPFAWDYMKRYVQSMASIFDGFRLDNCHGTQLNVARYMVKQARLANPNVIIFAQLFTDTDEQKALFVKSIGINSILKQTQHMLSGASFIYNLHESLGQGARYVGGLNRYMEEKDEVVKYSTRKKPLLLVYDLTHDNMTYCQKKIQVLQTPVTVLISLMGTFIGSTKGYDQFYARKIDVIQTEKLYSFDNPIHPTIDKSQIQKIKFTYPSQGLQSLSLFGSWNQWKLGTQMQICNQSNIFWAQIQIPPGHYEYKFFDMKKNQWKTHPMKHLTQEGNHQNNIPSGQLAFKHIYSNLEHLRKDISKLADKFFPYCQYYCYHINDVVIIIREGEQHQGSVCVIANLSTKPQKIPNNIQLPGSLVNSWIWHQSQFTMYEGRFFISQIVHSQNIRQYFDLAFNYDKGKHILITNQIPVGFSCLIQCQKTKQTIQNIRQVRDLVSRPIRLPNIDVIDCNMILHGCNRQQESLYGSSNYIIPQDGNKQLVYGGFAGIFLIVKNAKKQNDLSIKLFDNLRQGNWLMDYYLTRLKRYPSLQQITDKVEKVFNSLKRLERYLIPKYFSDFVYRFCHLVEDKMSNNSKCIFQRKLKTASAQFINKFSNQKPGFEILVAAGLPHFSTGWARCWGRDTFTCNQMLLLHPHVYKLTIMQFASALRHGMIPNLLDNGNHPRYNCRDACWWFIRGVKQYARKTGDYQIFKQKINLLFLTNDLIEHTHLKNEGKTKTMTVQQIIQEIIQTHAHGVSYRQWRAGYQIDSNMTTEGFNIQLTVDQKTGFINGGNQMNCLTWMDKMGSSTKAGNKGYPATPRGGQPVQLVGLLYHCLVNLIKLHEEGHYSFDEVIFKKRKIKYSEWAKKIAQNFEKQFFIPQQHSRFTSSQDLRSFQNFGQDQQIQDSRESKVKSSYVRLRGIYKDVNKAKIIHQEYRLRPNALITIALAPQIVNPEHAKAYLSNVQTYLLYPKSIGVATLAEIHQSLYVPYYDNSDNSAQIKVAHGFSYHNGPEWVWLYGFYIKAKILFDSQNKSKQQMLGLLQQHNNYINNDQWCSLPQMTNKNGQYNQFSCPAQAWSISSLLLGWQAINQMSTRK